MVLDALTSPRRKSQNHPLSSSSPSPKRHRDESGSWSILVERHRYLLTMLALLAFLCTIYLYFAVTLGASDSCSGRNGAEKALCMAKLVPKEGKLKLF